MGLPRTAVSPPWSADACSESCGAVQPPSGLRLRRVLAGLWLCLLAFTPAACVSLPAPPPGRSPVPGAPPGPAFGTVSLSPDDRILILAPHPDDETIGAGGIIQKAEELGLPVKVVYLTNGDANQWSFLLYRKRPEVGAKAVESMGEVRHGEAISATHLLGLQRDQLVFLGYPDFGNLRIWDSHWRDLPPYRALLTGATAVPYPDAYRPGAAYRGEEILGDIRSIISDFKPTKIFLPHPADQNPDHLALYLFTRVALWDLAADLHPELYPYLVHYPHWPNPLGYYPEDPLVPPAALSGEAYWLSEPLTESELQTKRQALQTHKTQYEARRRYLDSFLRTNELFGEIPDVSLRRDAGDVSLSQRALVPGERASDELTEQERARFVGLEMRSVRLDGSDLVFSIEFSTPLSEGVEASAYFFGYRQDQPFAAMPKLHVKFSEMGLQVYDGQRALPASAVSVTREARQLTLRVPVARLGDPRSLLFNARTYLGDVPLDSTEWRVLSLQSANE
jgi:LmbE family N-acetylglucosaminyl deacetylase